MMSLRLTFFYLLAHCLTVAVSAYSPLQAEESWPQFRGPLGNGHAPDAKIPVTWSESENVTWKVPVLGEGHSSPVIYGNQLWLTTAIVEKLSEEEQEARLEKIEFASNGLQISGALTLKALAFDIQSGKQIFEVDLLHYDAASPKHITNSYASPTPVIEKGRVYCHFGEYGICCVDTTTGKVLWKNQELKVDHQNGPGASPVMWNDLVIVHYDGIDHQFIAAFNKSDGKIAWKTIRSGKTKDLPPFKKAYCTPVITQVNGKPLLISPAADWVYGYDPETGKELCKTSYGKLGFSTVCKPVIGNGMVYICTGFMKSRLVAVKYEGAGDLSETNVVWHSDRQIPQKPSLLLLDKEIYFVNDKGIGICLDAMTGEQIWQERFEGKYSASPIYASGHIYFFNEEGKTTVIKPGKELNIVTENHLDAGFKASPAIIGDTLFLRTTTHLYRIEN